MNIDTRDPASELVDRIQELPPLPTVVFRLNELLANTRTSARGVASLLSTDPAIASKLLGVANSAYYGMVQRIRTLTHAVMVLGFNTVRNVVVSSTIVRSLSSCLPTGSPEHVRFWKHSVACGAASKALAQRLQHPQIEEYFILGLLHDVGKAVVRGWRPGDSRRIAELVHEGQDGLEAERSVLKATHAQIGGALLERWRLPPLYVDAVRYHHTPVLAGESSMAAAVVHVADVTVHALLLPSAEGERAPELSHEAWARVGLAPAELPGLLGETESLIAQAEAFLGPAAPRSD